MALYQNMTASAAAYTCKCCKQNFHLVGLSTKIDPIYYRYFGKDSKNHVLLFLVRGELNDYQNEINS